MQTLGAPTVNSLIQLELFASISSNELDHLTALIERRLYQSGEALIREGDIATQFFILIFGTLDVVKAVEGDTVEVLNVIEQSGELFGEMALVEDKPRSAGIVAREPAEVLVVQKKGFLELVNQFPQFTMEVARSISVYLRRTDSTLIAALEAKNRELVGTIEELKETRQVLVDNERLSIIGRMASTILHDLKNPMTTIAGFAQLMGMKERPYDEVVKYTQVITQQVKQFNTLAQELLTFARGGASLQLQTMDFPDCIQSTLTSIEFNLVQQKMQLETDIQSTGKIRIDPSRFFRVYENLANNAIEAMSAGGVLTIRSFQEADQLIMEIADTGHGMEAEVLEQAFDEFFTHKKHGGTGLGLAIVKSIVTEHQGEILVNSQPNQGTTFTIKLPLVTE